MYSRCVSNWAEPADSFNAYSKLSLTSKSLDENQTIGDKSSLRSERGDITITLLLLLLPRISFIRGSDNALPWRSRSFLPAGKPAWTVLGILARSARWSRQGRRAERRASDETSRDSPCIPLAREPTGTLPIHGRVLVLSLRAWLGAPQHVINDISHNNPRRTGLE